MSYLNVQVGKAHVKHVAKMIGKLCKMSPEFANRMVAHGLRGNVTPKVLKELMIPDTFTSTGKLAKNLLEEAYEVFDLTSKSTIKDCMQAILKAIAKT